MRDFHQIVITLVEVALSKTDLHGKKSSLVQRPRPVPAPGHNRPLLVNGVSVERRSRDTDCGSSCGEEGGDLHLGLRHKEKSG